MKIPMVKESENWIGPCRDMKEANRRIRFFWWNVQSFAHFEVNRASEEQWPIEAAEYAAKCERVDKSLIEIFGTDPPELMAFAEMTRQAAVDLRDRLFPDHMVFSLDLLPRSELQVAVLFNPGAGFVAVGPLVVPRVPRGTRAMAIVDHVSNGNRIRFIACHWTARFSDQSMHHRSDTAHFLNGEIYRYLQEDECETRHAVVIGDLNEEPYGLVEERLHASRDRARSRMRHHYRDQDVERIRLYNCAWRFLGERVPHNGAPIHGDSSGTYYWEKESKWRTPDHVIVNGSLLAETTPYLDEGFLRVAAGPTILATSGLPQKFRWNNGKPTGLSDHLPIFGQIILNRVNDNVNKP